MSEIKINDNADEHITLHHMFTVNYIHFWHSYIVIHHTAIKRTAPDQTKLQIL